MLEKIFNLKFLRQSKLLWQRYRWVIVGILGTFLTVTLVKDMLSPSSYTAKTTLMTLQNSSKLGGTSLTLLDNPLMGSMGPAGGLDVSQKLLNILNSRELGKAVVVSSGLVQSLNQGKPEDKLSLERLGETFKQQHAKFSVNRQTGLIEISITYSDPELAAFLANRFVEELQNYLNANSLTLAKRNRLFIEEQLESNKKEMIETEDKIRGLYVNVSAADSNLPEELQNQINAAMVKLNELKSSPGYQPSQAVAIEATIHQLEQQIAALKAPAGTGAPAQLGLPKGLLQYLLLKREVLKMVYSLVAQQYEIAKIEEAKDAIAFQVIDRALPPTVRTAPKIKQDMVRSFLLASLVCFAVLYFSESYLFPNAPPLQKEEKV